VLAGTSAIDDHHFGRPDMLSELNLVAYRFIEIFILDAMADLAPKLLQNNGFFVGVLV
jgi:hypothetical protein